MTDTRRPRNVAASLLALHAPEGLGLEPLRQPLIPTYRAG